MKQLDRYFKRQISEISREDLVVAKKEKLYERNWIF